MEELARNHEVGRDHVVQDHYQRLAHNYNQFLYYSPEFVRQLTSKMVEKLRLCQQDRLVDLGCGTGMYSLDILQQIPLQHPILGVDPFPEMLAEIPPDAPIQPLALDAVEFSAQPREYNKVLIKEAIHHIEQKLELFGNLYERLPTGGVMLLVHVPPRVQYPLFQEARQRCLHWHADPNQLVDLLVEAGFQVEWDSLDYPHAIPKEYYFNMVRECYMSVLTSFEPPQLEAGLAEMEAAHAGQETLEFIDHFDYLTATKA